MIGRDLEAEKRFDDMLKEGLAKVSFASDELPPGVYRIAPSRAKPVLVKKTIYYPSRLIEELYSDGHTELKQAGNEI